MNNTRIHAEKRKKENIAIDFYSFNFFSLAVCCFFRLVFSLLITTRIYALASRYICGLVELSIIIHYVFGLPHMPRVRIGVHSIRIERHKCSEPQCLLGFASAAQFTCASVLLLLFPLDERHVGMCVMRPEIFNLICSRCALSWAKSIVSFVFVQLNKFGIEKKRRRRGEKTIIFLKSHRKRLIDA